MFLCRRRSCDSQLTAIASIREQIFSGAAGAITPIVRRSATNRNLTKGGTTIAG